MGERDRRTAFEEGEQMRIADDCRTISIESKPPKSRGIAEIIFTPRNCVSFDNEGTAAQRGNHLLLITFVND